MQNLAERGLGWGKWRILVFDDSGMGKNKPSERLTLFYFQKVTIDCLSFPRCPGNILQAFRSMVLTAATTLKKTSDACHKLDVSILERYVKG